MRSRMSRNASLFLDPLQLIVEHAFLLVVDAKPICLTCFRVSSTLSNALPRFRADAVSRSITVPSAPSPMMSSNPNLPPSAPPRTPPRIEPGLPPNNRGKPPPTSALVALPSRRFFCLASSAVCFLSSRVFTFSARPASRTSFSRFAEYRSVLYIFVLEHQEFSGSDRALPISLRVFGFICLLRFTRSRISAGI